jgi:ribonuclease-3
MFKKTKEIGELENSIGVKFDNRDLLMEALTHRSYLNENPKWHLPHNERLEFLGDAVLELAATEKLYNDFPDSPEGQLTVLRAALVNYQTLAECAESIALEDYILMSRGEKMDNAKAREVILANAFEALIGAIYLDKNFKVAEKFIIEQVFVHLPKILETKSYKDAKSELQEIIQEKYKITPVYKILSETGPAHLREFVSGVFFGEERIAEGSGTSKQEAEVEAAKAALKKYK